MGYNILLGIGLFFLILSLCMIRNTLIFIKNGERTIGNVLYVEQSDNRDDDGKYSYTPVFKFRTKSNQEMKVSHTVSTSNANAWQEGQEVKLIYDPERPFKARLYSYFPLFNWGIIWMAFAMPFLVIGCGYWLFKLFLHF